VETRPSAQAGFPTAGGTASRPEYARVLEERVAALAEPDRTILQRRVMVERPLTLQALGDEVGVTRERIRQIEGRALGKVRQRPLVAPGRPHQELTAEEEALRSLDEHDNEVIASAIERLAELPLPATEAAVVGAGFEPFNAPLSRLLFELAGKANHFRTVIVDGEGRKWLGDVSHTPKLFLQRITAPVLKAGVVDDLVEPWSAIESELRPHTGSDEEAAALAADIIESFGLTEINGCYAMLSGRFSVPERLEHIMRANGGPMSVEELLPYFPDRSRGTVRNALTEIETFVRITREEYDLAERGAAALPSLLDLVFTEIDKHPGGVAMSYLRRVAEEHGYSAESIQFYGELPNLIADDGILRRRTTNDPPAVPEPGLDRRCLRVLAGVYRGCWSYISAVSYQRIYAGPERLPAPLGELLELDPGCRRQRVIVDGETPIRGSWGSYPYLFGSDFRPILRVKDLKDGDRVRIIVTGPKAIAIEVLPSPAQDPSPFDTLVAGAGLYDDTGTPVPDGEVIEALADAVGVDPAAPVAVLGMRLAKRRNVELYEALNLLSHGELSA
jgi:Sigma-70, region 4